MSYEVCEGSKQAPAAGTVTFKRRAMTQVPDKGECPVCGAVFRLTRDKTLRVHNDRRTGLQKMMQAGDPDGTVAALVKSVTTALQADTVARAVKLLSAADGTARELIDLPLTGLTAAQRLELATVAAMTRDLLAGFADKCRDDA